MLIVDGIMQLLDIDTGEYFECHPKDVFERYSQIVERTTVESAVYGPTRTDTIPFKALGKHLKIRDWTGWTELIEIKSHECQEDTLAATGFTPAVVNTDDTTIILTDNSNVVVYDPLDQHIAFHGEVQYKCKSILVGDIGVRPDGQNGIAFRHIDISTQFVSVRRLLPIPIMHNKNSRYSIETKSGFFNLSGFHMATDSKIEKIISSSVYK